MKNNIEIRKANEEELVTLAKKRVESFPLLREIFDEDFLCYLAKQKKDYDNELLPWLVLTNSYDYSIATTFLEEMEQNIALLEPICGLDFLKEKLRQWKTNALESTTTELEFATEYLKRDYEVELEPVLPNGRKADFLATKNRMKIYFEVKTIYQETTIEEQYTINEFLERFDRIEQPYHLNISIERGLKRTEVFGATKRLEKELRKIKDSEIPKSIALIEGGQRILEANVIFKNANGEKGGIGGFVFGGGIKDSWKDVRRKIALGISQLHPRHAGVIIVRPHGLETSEFDIENAVLGDLGVAFTCPAQPIRTRNGIFKPNINKRLSAVLFYKKKISGTKFFRKKVVYHNPFASIELPSSVFNGMNCIQHHLKSKNLLSTT